MFDSLSPINRLSLCLLVSAGLHGGVVLFDWSMSPASHLVLRTPVEVGRVEIATRNLTTPEVTPIVPEIDDRAPPVAPRHVEAPVTTMPRQKAQRPAPAEKSVEPVRHRAENATAPRTAPQPLRSSETPVNMMTQDVLASLPRDVVAPEAPASANADDATEQVARPVAGSVPDVLVEAVPDYRSNPLPEYPSLARQRRWEGVVWLQVDVTAEGRVQEVKVEKSSGHAVLDRSATRSVGRWRFVPATRGGMPVDCKVRLPVRFRLEEG